jgi:hypothetical protein
LRTAPLVPVAVLLAVACVARPQGYFTTTGDTVDRIDYAGWDSLLGEHVRDGVVDYPAFAGSRDFHEFRQVVRRARLRREITPPERLAFLVNAYNASAIAAILAGYSPEGLLGRGRFFRWTRWPVAGEEITLWDLEHHRLVPLGDPRVHFAIVCASASCPPLASEAYRPGRLEEQLEGAARRFVNDPTRNRFDPGARVAHLSRIFEWNRDEFVGSAGSLEAYLARYVADPAVARDLARGGWEIRYLDHDWSLNGIPPSLSPGDSGPGRAAPAEPE